MAGRLQFTVNDKEYSVESSMTVHIPPDSVYKVQNLHRSTAEVFYVAHTIPAPDDEQTPTQQ